MVPSPPLEGLISIFQARFYCSLVSKGLKLTGVLPYHTHSLKMETMTWFKQLGGVPHPGKNKLHSQKTPDAESMGHIPLLAGHLFNILQPTPHPTQLCCLCLRLSMYLGSSILPSNSIWGSRFFLLLFPAYPSFIPLSPPVLPSHHRHPPSCSNQKLRITSASSLPPPHTS